MKMCEFSSADQYSFRWITYLVVVIGVYTFVHWFLATPLTYSHVFECCNETWPKNWIVWFLFGSFCIWFTVALLVFFVWLCVRKCCGKRLNESSIHLTEIKTGISQQEKGKETSSFHEVEDHNRNSEKIDQSEPKKEILVLPDMPTAKNTTAVVNVNEVVKCFGDSPIPPPTDFTISVEETRHYVQRENSEEKPEKNSLKSPRDIFFKDLIEAAANTPKTRNSFFDFDPAEIGLEKDEREEKSKKNMAKHDLENSATSTGNTYFMGSRDGGDNVTTEIYVALDERGIVEKQTLD